MVHLGLVSKALLAQTVSGSKPNFVTGDADVYVRLAKFYAQSEFNLAKGHVSGSADDTIIVQQMLSSGSKKYFEAHIPINTSGVTKVLRVYPVFK